MDNITVFESFRDMTVEQVVAFSENFTADDWDFIIINTNVGGNATHEMARKLHPTACALETAEIDGKEWIVTYHS